MDLIITDGNKKDIALVSSYKLDLAFGDEDNDFVVLLPSNYSLEKGSVIYVDNSSIGGIVDKVIVDESVSYKGRTFSGILSNKILKSPVSVTGIDANEALRRVITALDLNDIFVVDNKSSGITINTTLEKYKNGWETVRNMLRSAKAKPTFLFNKGKITIGAAKYNNVGNMITSDIAMFKLERNYLPVNHLIVDAVERDSKTGTETHTEYNFYADKKGNVSERQSIFGVDEIAIFQSRSMGKDVSELKKSSLEKLKEYQVDGDVDIDGFGNEIEFDIGDMVTAYNPHINESVTAEVIEKIVKVDGRAVNIKYSVGQPTYNKLTLN